MKLAVFSPLPPAQSGIADYCQALLPGLAKHFQIEVFLEESARHAGFGPEVPITVRQAREFRPQAFDAVLYQLGNNADHAHVYDAALQCPGIVVLHEFNLHHLLTDVTIRRGDWPGYLREVEHEGGAEALAYAHRAASLEVGPDYELPMNRRILEGCRAVIVHSRFMVDKVLSTGILKPVTQIPHGAWLPEIHHNTRRAHLGLDESTPLIGIFGFLKPYKRITEALRAMQRLVRVDSRVKMILVGEEHPEYPLRRLVDQMGLREHVRLLGYVPADELEQYIAAVDVCLNLRYPTVGETSGTLQRALGLGRAVIVSDVGSFAELPDEICLKAPVGTGEIDTLYEYLNLLVSRPDFARAMGMRARTWVATEFNWTRVSDLYADWIRAVAEGTAASVSADGMPASATPGYAGRNVAAHVEASAVASTSDAAPQNGNDAREGSPTEFDIVAEYIRGFYHNHPGEEGYIENHITRLVRTLEITPPGGPGDRILEMGAYLQITPALKTRLGYGEVRGSYLGQLGRFDEREVKSRDGERFSCRVDHFDAEKDRYPYPDGYFSTVLCCELLEHLYNDPMHMMVEVNRILKPGGHFVLSTPNICSARAIGAVLLGYHPGLFHQYIRPAEDGTVDPRHAREYAPRDVQALFEAAGLEVVRLETGPYLEKKTHEYDWVQQLLERYQLPHNLRGEAIYAVGRKTGDVRSRYPEQLYTGAAE